MKRRDFRRWLVTQVEVFGQASAPISEANRWLITGPDTMPSADRSRLHRLLDFHRFTRQGTMKPEHTREFWLAIPEFEYFGSYWMKQTYHINLISRLMYDESPFFALLPKSPKFHGASA